MSELSEFQERVLQAVLETLNKPMRVVLEPHIRRHIREHPELAGKIRQLVYEYHAQKPCSRCGQPVGYPSLLVIEAPNREHYYCRNCLESLFHAYQFLEALTQLFNLKPQATLTVKEDEEE